MLGFYSSLLIEAFRSISAALEAQHEPDLRGWSALRPCLAPAAAPGAQQTEAKAAAPAQSLSHALPAGQGHDCLSHAPGGQESWCEMGSKAN